MSETTRAKRTTAAQSEQASRRLGLFPAAMTSPAPASGARTARRSRMSVWVPIALTLQFGDLLRMDGAIIPVHRYDDAEGDRNLGRRQTHDEEDENLPDRGIGGDESIQRHHVERRGRKDDFAGNEHADECAPADEAVDPRGQEKRGDRQVSGGLGVEGGRHWLLLPPRAITRAPRIATSSTSEISSNGRLYVVSREMPRALTEPSEASAVAKALADPPPIAENLAIGGPPHPPATPSFTAPKKTAALTVTAPIPQASSRPRNASGAGSSGSESITPKTIVTHTAPT